MGLTMYWSIILSLCRFSVGYLHIGTLSTLRHGIGLQRPSNLAYWDSGTELPIDLLQCGVPGLWHKEVTKDDSENSNRAVYESELATQTCIARILQVRISEADREPVLCQLPEFFESPALSCWGGG